ncbi:MAG: response regulator [Gammaproteobacteria bacterium]|nr:response regulator [Gammaproteobacteria bacterium]
MPGLNLNVIIVKDSEDDTELLLRLLGVNGFKPNYRQVCSENSLRVALQRNDWDLIISDFQLSAFSGIDALSIVKRMGLDIPFIVVSDVEGEDKVVEAMIAGAHDYVTKHNLSRLIPAIRRELDEAISRRPLGTLAEKEPNAYKRQLEERIQEQAKELQLMQSALLRRERMAILGQLVATVSHELCNPLGVIRNAVFLLKRALPDAGCSCRGYVDIVEREVDTADRIISNLSEATRTKESCHQTVNLDRLVDEVLASICYPNTVLFHYQRNPKPYTIYADRVQVKQVISNLLANAFHAVGKKGHVFLLVRATGVSDVLTIVDTGAGIPLEVQQSVFEPLYTTKAKGTGLGLWVSKEIICQHNGHLRILDEADLGVEELEAMRQLVNNGAQNVVAIDDLQLGACFEVSLPPQR